MKQSEIENGQPEPKLNNEPQTIETTSAQVSANAPVIGCTVRENNASIKKYLESLSKLIPIEWDRFTEDEDGDFNIYGWIKRKDGQRDFVLLNLFLEDGNIRSYKSGFATSSAKYSKMIYMCLYGTTKGHNSCRKIESMVV
jgi:hypothetical protein